MAAHAEAGPASGWGEIRTALQRAAEACAAAADALHAAAEHLRGPALDEAVIEAQRSRAAEEALAAAGAAVPPPRGGHLRPV